MLQKYGLLLTFPRQYERTLHAAVFSIWCRIKMRGKQQVCDKENYELWTTQEEIFSGKPMVDYLFQHSTNVIYIQSAIKEFLTFLLQSWQHILFRRVQNA